MFFKCFRKNNCESCMQSIRLSAAIIVLITLMSGATDWLKSDTASTLTLIMALVILMTTYKEYLEKNPKIKFLVMIAVAALFALAVVVFVLQSK